MPERATSGTPDASRGRVARTPLEDELARARETRAAAGLARTLDEAPHGADLVSNDTLGLARDPRVVAAAVEALREHGAGGRAARLLGGGSPEHAALEAEAADWLDAEAALLFPSGYQANLGVVGALVGPGDAIVSDRLVHASLIDAARLSRARVLTHRHGDLAALEARLHEARNARRRLVLTEGVFSMDGDAAPLKEVAAACARHGAWLVVDEAHAAGLLGPEGAGAWAAARARHDLPPAVSSRLAARIVTGGKALGAAGAIVAGGRALIDELVDRARTFVFTTAPPPAAAAAMRAAIAIVRAEPERRERVLGHARALAERLRLPAPAAAIVPYVLGSSARAVAVAEELQRRGLDVRAVRPPTVPEGASRLRLVLHASNTASELDELARILERHAPVLPPAPVRGARPLFVVGTDTGIGKTVVSALLFLAARARGAARYWKPVQTGTDSDSETVAQLTDAAPFEILRPAWSLPLPASPHEAATAAGTHIDPARLDEALEGLVRTLPDTRLVVELAGGLLVAYTDSGETQADWLARARPELVLVARSGLGTLNHTLLTLEALRARHLSPRALVLVGEPHASNQRTLERLAGVERVVSLPPLPALTPALLKHWLEEHPLDDLVS